MANSISTPFPFFAGLDGKALVNGKIYIGDDGLDARTNPKATFFDEALTEPAAQPVRTIAGYASDAGSAAQLFTDGDYSISVYTATDVLVFSSLSEGGDIATLQAEIDANTAAIAVNAADIDDLETDVAANTAAIGVVGGTDFLPTTSGSEISQAIPAGVQEVTIFLNGVSIEPTAVQAFFRMGTSGVLQDTGYNVATSSAVFLNADSVALSIPSSDPLYGTIKARRAVAGAHYWDINVTAFITSQLVQIANVTLSGELDIVAIKHNTVDFDAGSISVRWR